MVEQSRPNVSRSPWKINAWLVFRGNFTDMVRVCNQPWNMVFLWNLKIDGWCPPAFFQGNVPAVRFTKRFQLFPPSFSSPRLEAPLGFHRLGWGLRGGWVMLVRAGRGLVIQDDFWDGIWYEILFMCFQCDMGFIWYMLIWYNGTLI